MNGVENQAPFLASFTYTGQGTMVPCIKGTGGVRVKKIFFDDSDSKFSVLSPAFYGIWKSRPEGPQFCGFVGVGGAPGGKFWPFVEIWCPESQKNSKKSTLLIFKWLNMIQEVFQKVNSETFVILAF